MSSRDDTELRAGIAERADGGAGEITRLRAEHEDLASKLSAAQARLAVLEQKLKQSLMHLVTAEGIRAERDQLRTEVITLRRSMAGLTDLEAERDQLRARLANTHGGGEPGERIGEPGESLSEALGQLARVEVIRAERQALRSRVVALEDENERLRTEVARLGHPSAPRRAWLPKLARHE